MKAESVSEGKQVSHLALTNAEEGLDYRTKSVVPLVQKLKGPQNSSDISALFMNLHIKQKQEYSVWKCVRRSASIYKSVRMKLRPETGPLVCYY